ncbi:hypothetical protein Glove_590g43 [Diversispora epigaea]|uniref:Uncharacterized protein n=1 Tax=Diversispora epigaea TaxID=1348612 RepID=A0A397GCJ8_9GLOM|nr:hypothetical protein Glove_590g43 [Diversispora epigaea]
MNVEQKSKILIIIPLHMVHHGPNKLSITHKLVNFSYLALRPLISLIKSAIAQLVHQEDCMIEALSNNLRNEHDQEIICRKIFFDSK